MGAHADPSGASRIASAFSSLHFAPWSKNCIFQQCSSCIGSLEVGMLPQHELFSSSILRYRLIKPSRFSQYWATSSTFLFSRYVFRPLIQYSMDISSMDISSIMTTTDWSQRESKSGFNGEKISCLFWKTKQTKISKVATSLMVHPLDDSRGAT